jgi:glycosyltransferase involved in cell wall biosynthesis
MIVDDGSLDHTVSYIRNAIKDDDRFQLLTQTNQGISAARNAALSQVTGEFVTFLDGDDELESNCLETCSCCIGDNDLLIFGITNIYYSNNVEIQRVKASPYVTSFVDGRELADWYVKYHAILLYSCGNKMFRTSVIRQNGLCFHPEINWGEDRVFNYRFLAYCKKIRSVSDCFYLYKHMNEQSLTSRFRKHHIDTLLKLHYFKMEYLLPLAASASAEEKAEFRQYDIQKEVSNAFLHIAEHGKDLSQEEVEEEYTYLNHISVPAYFYDLSDDKNAMSENNRPDLVKWITQKVYGAVEENGTCEQDVVIILGSRSCAYRVDAAVKQFGHVSNLTFICSGGNASQYLDRDGKELVEADYMYEYLLQCGIKENAILVESHSHNTSDNIENSIKLYRGLSKQKKSVKYAIVTASFHKARVQQILQRLKYNIPVFVADGPHTSISDWYKNQIGINVVFSELMKLSTIIEQGDQP